MARKSFVLVVTGTIVFFLCTVSFADVPHMINYQGKLTTAQGGCMNDTVSMTFSIYPDTLSPLAEWTETQDSVIVKEGIFNVLLGSVDSIPASVFSGSIKYLGVQVESDPEMTPLKPMVSVAYAYRAGAVDGGPGSGWVDDGTVVRLETSTDYVGIGTPTPGNKLHIVGSESVPILNVEQYGSFRAVRVYSQNACALWVANAGNHGLRVSNAGGDGIHVEQAGNNGIRVKNAGGFAGYFEGSGYFRDNVGIGTASPGSKLEINGDGTLQFAINNTSGRNWVMRSDNTGKFSLWDFSGLNEAYVVSSSGAPGAFTFQFNGNVGVGTASPNYKLDVQGTVGIDIGSNFNDIPLTINVPSNQAGLISRIAKGGSVINVVDKDGNVGIGTTNPQGALDVNSTTGALIVPRMTTAQRNALTAVNGMIIYNTSTNQFNFYENGAWVTK